MSFRDDLARFVLLVRTRNATVFANTVAAVKDSVINGSALTGAPGQPVDTGALKASWNVTFEGPFTALVQTNMAYAPPIEEGVWRRNGKSGPITFRSLVGGPHSVALTTAGFPNIVSDVTKKVTGQ